MPATPEEIRAALQAQIKAIEGGAQARTPFQEEPPFGRPSSLRERPSYSHEAPDDLLVDLGPRAASSELLGGISEANPQDPQNPHADPAAAFRKIERLCLVREQASEQLRQRLARDGFEPDAVETAVARALACGLVDDSRFADVLVRSRLAQGRGRRGIAAELEALGIDADGVEALAAGDGDDAGEVDRALALLDRKPPRAKNRRDAAYRRLAGKGFSASVSSTAARLWCESNPE
ncbi:regulatory protein RecX [Eggerthella sinensis]|uniref:regulatory protein RecX n=1 Tax=Eggerthella sinensis TaxID=242230 RepID=UPI001D08D001|nr:regulatory protein RecX [Eggerthella sinensis]MCB7036936.1 recombination regulator RecX [Eggerthella sinensis]